MHGLEGDYMASPLLHGVILGFYWGYMGLMEKKMETTIMGYIGFRVYRLCRIMLRASKEGVSSWDRLLS